MSDLCVEVAKEILVYDPTAEGSCLRWKISPCQRVPAGARAGTKNSAGYWKIRWRGKEYRAHRLVWTLSHGETPKAMLDHKDRNKGNNKLENLRLATRGAIDNAQNMSVYKNSKTQCIGVRKQAKSGKWLAAIQAEGIRYNLGTFNSLDEAKEAYTKAKGSLHTFSPNQTN